MDVYALDGSESFSTYENNRKEPMGYDATGREFKNITHSTPDHLSIKPLMSKPDKTTGEINGSWDEERGARIEGKITWVWESKDESKDTASQNKGDTDTSCHDADSKDKPQ